MVMRSKKIDPTPRELPDLMNSIKDGTIRIPGFQRDFVWDTGRVQTLLDSMCKEYPVGTILLWRAPSNYNHLLREDVDIFGQPEKEQGHRYYFLLDGQQRLTSLYATINGLTVNGEDFSKIVADLDIDVNNEYERRSKQLFRYRTADNQRYVSVKDLLGDQNLTIFEKLPSTEHKQRFQTYMSILRNYPFSVVTVSDMEIGDAIEIFERINRQGRRLDRYDLVAASLFTEDFDLRKRTSQDIQNYVKEDFGQIPQAVIPQVLALNIKGNAEYSTQMSLVTAEVSTNWVETANSIRAAVRLFQNHFGVVNESFLPYDALIPVLSHYFFKIDNADPSPDQLSHIERWFWSVSFSERYSGTSQTRMSEDAIWLQDMLHNGAPYPYMVTLELQSLVETKITSTTSAARNGFLCMLKLQRPRHPHSGVEISIDKEAFPSLTATDQYRIFPNFLVNKGLSVHSLANFWFIPATLGQHLKIAESRPSEYMKRIKDMYGNPIEFERVMLSHLIPVGDDSGIWTDDYELFLQQRAKLLLARIFQLAGIGQAITDHDPVVDALEEGVRNLIDHELSTQHGSMYWPSRIPMAQAIEKRINGDARKSVMDKSFVLSDPRRCLDYANPKDYWEIIEFNLSNDLFANHHKDAWERYLSDFQDYRNTTQHTRKADTLLAARGLVASIWLSRVLGIDLSKYGVF